MLKCDNDGMKLHFATYTIDELNTWIEKIKPLIGHDTCDTGKQIQAEPGKY